MARSDKGSEKREDGRSRNEAGVTTEDTWFRATGGGCVGPTMVGGGGSVDTVHVYCGPRDGKSMGSQRFPEPSQISRNKIYL